MPSEQARIKIKPMEPSMRPLQEAALRILNQFLARIRKQDRDWVYIRNGSGLASVAVGVAALYLGNPRQSPLVDSIGVHVVACTTAIAGALLAAQYWGGSKLALRNMIASLAASLSILSQLTLSGVLNARAPNVALATLEMLLTFVALAPDWLQPLSLSARKLLASEPSLIQRIDTDRPLYRFWWAHEFESWIMALAKGKDPVDAYRKLYGNDA